MWPQQTSRSPETPELRRSSRQLYLYFITHWSVTHNLSPATKRHSSTLAAHSVVSAQGRASLVCFWWTLYVVHVLTVTMLLFLGNF